MDEEVSKISIAMQHLETAATLWLHETSLYSSLHLAGAAEEISGLACTHAGLVSEFIELRDRVLEACSSLGIQGTSKEVARVICQSKNSVKHFTYREERSVRIDPKVEAAHHISAAFRNFRRLGLEDQLSESVKRVVELQTIYVEIDLPELTEDVLRLVDRSSIGKL